MRAVTDLESFRIGILTLRVWKARIIPTSCNRLRYTNMRASKTNGMEPDS